MPSYRLLVFHGNRLSGSETFQAAGHVAAIQQCVGRHIGARIEIWAAEGRIAIIGSTTHRAHHGQLDRTDPIIDPLVEVS